LVWRNLIFSCVGGGFQGQGEITGGKSPGKLPEGITGGKSPGENHRGEFT